MYKLRQLTDKLNKVRRWFLSNAIYFLFETTRTSNMGL